MNLLFSIQQADKFGQVFSEAIRESFPDLRPTVTINGGDPTGFGPIKVTEVVVRTDNKLYFSIEDARLQKYYFYVLPVIRGTIEDNEVVVVIHWEVDDQVDTKLYPNTSANGPIGQMFQQWTQRKNVISCFHAIENEKNTADSRKTLENILREKDSSITQLISEPKRVGLNDYEKAKELIQEYLDEFSAIVFMEQLLDTYG